MSEIELKAKPAEGSRMARKRKVVGRSRRDQLPHSCPIDLNRDSSEEIYPFMREHGIRTQLSGEKKPVYVYKAPQFKKRKASRSQSLKRSLSVGDTATTLYPFPKYPLANQPRVANDACESTDSEFNLVPPQAWPNAIVVRAPTLREVLTQWIHRFEWRMIYEIDMVYVYMVLSIALVIFAILYAAYSQM